MARLPARTRTVFAALLADHPEALEAVEQSLNAREQAIAARDTNALRAAFEADRAMLRKLIEEGIKESLTGSV